MIQLRNQAFANFVKVGDLRESAALACLCTLTIARVQCGDVPGTVSFLCDGS
jgi:hypothetical protein